jgi:hypothetical protein
MRGALLLALVSACTIYDPVDEIKHREYSGTRAAIGAILDEVSGTHVYAIGEYHPTRNTVARTSPLARFTGEIVELLEPRAQHLIVEAWLDDTCRTSDTDAIQMQVYKVTNRAAAQVTDLQALLAASKQMQIQTHGLPMTCIEHASVLDGDGRVDFLRLLLLVTEKLNATARAMVAQGRDVIVYGGALHNDLYPTWPLDDLSYAKPLDEQLGGGVLEIDLVVPEIVAPMAMIRREPWFPLLGRAAPDRVITWQRGPHSYVVILPAQDYEAAKVAKPVALL